MPSTRANVTATVGGNSFFAGKNRIINGDFQIWQRGTSTSLTNGVRSFGADRFQAQCNFSAGTASVSQQSFTAGTAPVAGYEGTFFSRLTCGSTSTYARPFHQAIEDVRTFAGQTVTVSFWAKASTTLSGNIYLIQEFGSGGSAAVNYASSSISVTTAWTRFTFTQALNSISGKTIGTGSSLIAMVEFGSGLNSATLDIWGVQVEAGSVATPFETATGTLQGELAACQRYYTKSARTATTPGDGNNYDTDAIYATNSTHSASGMITQYFAFPVNMRVAPTMTFFRTNLSATNGRWGYYNGSWVSATSTTSISTSDKGFSVNMDGSYTVNSVYPISGAFTASAEL
jgi:hypothetical protein